MTATLVALRDHDVHAGLHMVQRMFFRAGQRRHQHAVVVRGGDHIVGRGSQRVGDQLDLTVLSGVLHRDVDVRARDGMQPAEHARVDAIAVRQRWHTEVVERPLHKGPVLGRDHRVEIHLASLGGDLGRHHDVDAEGLAVGVLVHPFQDRVEFFGLVEPHTPEDPEPTGPADGRSHMLARCEPEDGVVDAETVGQFGTHVSSFPARAAPRRRDVPGSP